MGKTEKLNIKSRSCSFKNKLCDPGLVTFLCGSQASQLEKKEKENKGTRIRASSFPFSFESYIILL